MASRPPIIGIYKSINIREYALIGHLHGLSSPYLNFYTAIAPFCASSMSISKCSLIKSCIGKILKSLSSTTNIRA